jgi:hypothetical protein
LKSNIATNNNRVLVNLEISPQSPNLTTHRKGQQLLVHR